MDKNLQLDKIRGSLIGGAVGDALGYPVEFIYSNEAIQKQYGENGITELDATHWWVDENDSNSVVSPGKAWISDDTQMTLFTACGLLNAKAKGMAPKFAICEAYIEWLFTQTGWPSHRFNDCWINRIPELNKRRAPGHTCISSLNEILRGKDPCNNSKGCGGIMRTAPVALYGAVWRNKPEGEIPEGRISNIKDVAMFAAEAAEITHQHPLGWLPSALEACLIYRLVQNEHPTVDNFKAYLTEGYDILMELYPNEKESINFMKELNDKALSLVDSPHTDVENITAIGEGWTAEETLAIALYCTVKYFTDPFDIALRHSSGTTQEPLRTGFEKAIVASVNHGGDSDSTGAVTGNILGAVVGYEAIPQHFKDKLELHDVILHVADDLWRGEHTKYNH